MKNTLSKFGLILFVLLVMTNVSAFAQEKFDILSFQAPNGWQKSTEANAVQFVKQNGNAVGIMMLFKSIPTEKDSRTTFDASWDSIVKDLFDKVDEPQMQPTGSENGWTIENGAAIVEKSGDKAVANLISATGGGKVVNLLIIYNSESLQSDVERFFASIDLPKVSANTSTTTETPSNENARLIGRWQNTSSLQSGNYSDNYITKRYEFRDDGSYSFTQRMFGMSISTVSIVKENGTYSIKGNQITITPRNSVIEGYAKDGGGDTLGRLNSSQKRKLETVSYQFTFHYFEGINEWNLVFQAARPTERDGPFSSNTTYKNAWYFTQKYTNTDLTSPKGK
ncbi:MAG: lipocalin family protein [Pyrinomonadaceae bacterium]